MLRIASGGTPGDMEEGVDAVLDVEVAFPLQAVPEYPQPIGMFEQLLIEIEHVAMRVTFAENRNETKDIGFVDVSTLRIGREQSFAHHHPSSVEGGSNGEGVVCGCRSVG